MDYTGLDQKHEYYNANRHLIPAEVAEKYEMAFLIEFTHNSTAIEGNTLSLIETKLIIEDGISVGGKSMREIYESANHKKAFGYMRERLGEKKPLDEVTVKDIHEILMENIFQGGIYRNTEVSITGANYQPPAATDMYIQIKNFFADFAFKKDMHPVEFAAWTHAEFVRIHPFADGNGRASRMIMNYQLMFYGWLPVSVLNKDRLDYYNALGVYAVDGNIEPFAGLIAGLEHKELDRMIRIIDQVKTPFVNK